MTLDDLHKALAGRAPGLGAFETFIEDCEQGIASQPEFAGFYSLLAGVAQRFRDRYNQEPLSQGTVTDAQTQLLGLVEAANQAAANDAVDQVETLNAIARAELE